MKFIKKIRLYHIVGGVCGIVVYLVIIKILILTAKNDLGDAFPFIIVNLPGVIIQGILNKLIDINHKTVVLIVYGINTVCYMFLGVGLASLIHTYSSKDKGK